MLPYRLKQLLWALRHRLTVSEKAWVDRALTDRERELFYAMHAADQSHAFRVAESVRLNVHYQKLPPWEKQLTVRLALLHDVGRTGARFLIVKKILHVLLSLIPGTRRLAPFKEHESRGVHMLQDIASADVAELLSHPDHAISQIVVWADNFN